MNAGSVEGIPWGDGNTQTFPYAKILFELIALAGSEDAKTLGLSTCTCVQALMPSFVPSKNTRTQATWRNFHHKNFLLAGLEHFKLSQE